MRWIDMRRHAFRHLRSLALLWTAATWITMGSAQPALLVDVGPTVVQGGLVPGYRDGEGRKFLGSDRSHAFGFRAGLAVLVRPTGGRGGLLIGPEMCLGSQRAMIRSESTSMAPSSLRSEVHRWTGRFDARMFQGGLAVHGWWQALPPLAVTAGPAVRLAYVTSTREAGTVETTTIHYDPGWVPQWTEVTSSSYVVQPSVEDRMMLVAGLQAGLRYQPLPGLLLSLVGGVEFGATDRALYGGRQAFGALTVGWLAPLQAAAGRSVEN
ncbi:MAG: hypothetical protein GFGODING_01157 [Flavobacteriales bacterium]|nr:hypothetical protein [Flavobacteriales bacterium]